MILGILSDSHDNLPKLKNAVSLFNKKAVSLVLHAGDYVAPFSVGMLENNLKCEYLGIFGNNDGEKEGLIKRSQGKISQQTLELEKFGKKIFLIHDISSAKVDFQKFDLLIHGHTHQPSIEKQDQTWLINPGECGGWLTGESTVVIYDLISGTPKFHRI